MTSVNGESARELEVSDLLPRYDKPPVSEVVMSIQFEPLVGLTPVHLGRWWTNPRKETYPICEEHPPIEPTMEEFDVPGRAGFSLTLSASPPTPAVWFLTSGREELLQVQRDRFTRNWTRRSLDESYPSYRTLLPPFQTDFEEFCEFLAANDLETPSITQCELTYINPIHAGEAWERLGQLDQALAPWSGSYSEGFLPEPEDVQLAMRYRIPDSSGSPVGRLVVTVQPGNDSASGRPLYLLSMVARGRPIGVGLDGALAFLNLAHEWIVRSFTTLTTPRMHALWERTR